MCIEKIVEKISQSGCRVHILGLGKPSEKIRGIRYHLIPYFAYTRFGNITCASPALGFLWYLPLYLAALSAALFLNPKAIIYNGLTSGLILSPFFKLFGKKNIIMYHSVIGYTSGVKRSILRFLFRFVDFTVVNSIGSRDDLSSVVSGDELFINDHYADEIFFNSKKNKRAPGDDLRVLYVGRIDKDKRVFPLIDFSMKMKNNPNYRFTFVGMGADVNKVANLSREYKYIKYGGYINEKKELAELYQWADVVWSFADVTYLALPAVESLASGAPIIIPKYAAIAGKDELIMPSLVPDSIGWLVDPFDENDVAKTMKRIQEKKEYIHKNCLEYAREHYSNNNLVKTAQKVKEMIV